MDLPKFLRIFYLFMFVDVVVIQEHNSFVRKMLNHVAEAIVQILIAIIELEGRFLIEKVLHFPFWGELLGHFLFDLRQKHRTGHRGLAFVNDLSRARLWRYGSTV